MRRVWLAVGAAVLLSVTVDVARGIPYPVPAFWALFGLAGTAVLIVLAKGPMRAWLQRPQDYYAADQDGWEGERG